MQKSGLIDQVHHKLTQAIGGCDRDFPAMAVDATLAVIKQAMEDGEPVNLSGFGKFEVVTRKARKGRNPQTNELIDIPARKAVRFTPCKALKEAVQ